MGYNEQFRQAVKLAAIGNEKLYSEFATVNAVEGSFCTVTPLNNEVPIEDVPLMAADNEQGFLITPKVGSIVLISWFSKNTPFVSLFSEIESLYLRGDSNGGLVKVSELVDRLNNIENAFNSFVNTYNIHTHSGNGVPTQNRANTTSTTDREQIESKTVKHG